MSAQDSSPRPALAPQTLLVIDAGSADASLLFETLAATPADTEHSYRDLFFAAPPQAAAARTHLRAWLRLERPDAAAYEALLHLRAAVIDWDRVVAAETCCRELREQYPGLPIFILQAEEAGAEVHDFFAREGLGDVPFVYSGDGRYQAVQQLRRQLDAIVATQYETPYWSSLQRYAGHPIISFHALPIGQSRSLSASLNDFAAFYGQRHFTAETSLSTAPLDSLLQPRSTIKRAQAKAAHAFGAQIGLDPEAPRCGTRFVTNGTSTANAIIVAAFVKPGDTVLMDRTCHISLHQALAYAHARPAFLKPFANPWGLNGAVPLQRIEAGLTRVLETDHRLPAAIILTNPTFDGIFCRPRALVARIAKVLAAYWRRHRGSANLAALIAACAQAQPHEQARCAAAAEEEPAFLALAFRRLLFLFDEAWSACAYFHPRLIELTAMHAAWHLSRLPETPYGQGLRVYATQSTHKSLSALRQGSMIHFRDPLMELPEVRQVFEQAYRAHCTTSPSASIIASLDVARRQAQLEGAYLVEKSIRLAEQFRRELAVDAERSGGLRHFFVIDAKAMMQSADPDAPDLSPEEGFLDPTRVSLSWDLPFSGATMRQLLLQHGIQVNKYDNRSVLVIFNIGIDESSVQALRQTLHSLGEALPDAPPDWVQEARPTPVRLPEFPGIHGQRTLGYWLQNQGAHQAEYHAVAQVLEELCQGREPAHTYVAASFVTPYPPGCPVLVPGQIVTAGDLQFLLDITVKEIFGAERTEQGLCIMLYRLKAQA